jgi:hypothetical protein
MVLTRLLLSGAEAAGGRQGGGFGPDDAREDVVRDRQLDVAQASEGLSGALPGLVLLP